MRLHMVNASSCDAKSLPLFTGLLQRSQKYNVALVLDPISALLLDNVFPPLRDCEDARIAKIFVPAVAYVELVPCTFAAAEAAQGSRVI